MENKKDKLLIVVSFGTSYLDTLEKNIQKCEDEIRNAYRDYDVKRAFTSKFIIAKLKRRDGIEIDDLEKSILSAKVGGYKEVIIVPLHLMPGKEFDDVRDTYIKYKSLNFFDVFNLGRPLLYRSSDFMEVIDALKFQVGDLGKDEAVVLMGHGSYHPGHAIYSYLQNLLVGKGLKNYVIGTIEGFPLIENVIDELNKQRIKKVKLAPLMLVCGDHGTNDMVGEDEDSWLNTLTREGFEVTPYVHGLGENEKIRELYLLRARDAINGENLHNI